MFKPVFLFIALFASLFAQAQPNKKVAPALQKFLNTEFMVKFHDLHIEAESQCISVQARQGELAASDVYRLRAAYDQSAHRANQLLQNIKQDFLNPKKIKTIGEFPDMYADGLRFKLQELADFYAANFQQALADASIKEEEVDGAALLLLVTELIGLSKGLANYFGDIRREARQYTEAHLDEHLVRPFRWRYWDELAGSVSPYESYDKDAGLPDFPASQESDPLDQQLEKWNQKLENKSQDAPAEDLPWDDVDNLPAADSTDSEAFKYDDWSPEEPPADPAVEGRDEPSKTNDPKKPAMPKTGKPEVAPKPAAKSKVKGGGMIP